MIERPLLIAGPTASGKSAYALARARECPSVIINADSMQVYADLRVLTARPTAAEMGDVPHALYGFVPGEQAYSTGRFVRDVRAELERAKALHLRPIIVGGTGLYFKALLEGLSEIPEVPADVRDHWRARETEVGATALHAHLMRVDPVTAARLQPGDAQRIVRALEVLVATGTSLSEWQAVPGVPVLQTAQCECAVMRVERAALYARADQRFDQMIAQGALDEVRALLARGLAPELPMMRAVGVPQLVTHLAGSASLVAASDMGKLATRHYIKRQETWIRRNMSAWNNVFL
jgi:tRNA dimethylallyltransferase